MCRLFIACALGLLLPLAARGADWPQFRGPDGVSYADEADLPLTWGKGKNVGWQTPLPKAHNPFSSPIAAAGRVYLTFASNKLEPHTVMCVDADDGKILWQTPIEPGPWKLTDLRGGYGAPTPCADEGHVYALFGSAVLACLDREGKIVWRKALPSYQFDVAIGTSPLLVGDLLIVQADQNGKKSSLIAFDKGTGEIRWDKPRPGASFSHSTPIVATVKGKRQLIVAGSNAIQGVDPASGEVIWSVEGGGETSSPAIEGNFVYVDTGRGFGGAGVSVDLSGDKPVVKWSAPANQIGEGLGSPLIVDGLLYRLSHNDLLACRDVASGEVRFSEHLPKVSSWASPFHTRDGRVYFASAGKSYVLKAGAKAEVLATNDLDDPDPAASPAVANGCIYLRGTQNLYCIGGPR